LVKAILPKNPRNQTNGKAPEAMYQSGTRRENYRNKDSFGIGKNRRLMMFRSHRKNTSLNFKHGTIRNYKYFAEVSNGGGYKKYMILIEIYIIIITLLVIRNYNVFVWKNIAIKKYHTISSISIRQNSTAKAITLFKIYRSMILIYNQNDHHG
jgi:hypothetical protein